MTTFAIAHKGGDISHITADTVRTAEGVLIFEDGTFPESKLVAIVSAATKWEYVVPLDRNGHAPGCDCDEEEEGF